MSHTHQRGFTLIELLMVIAIISCMMTLVLASTQKVRSRTRDVSRIANMHDIYTALEIWNNDHGRYPCHTPESSAGGQILSILTNQRYVNKPLRDVLNTSNLIYYYGSYKDTAGGGCGAIAELNVDFEDAQSECPFGGKILAGGHHCHMFIPHPLPCTDPFIERKPTWPSTDPTCVPLMDNGGASDPNDY